MNTTLTLEVHVLSAGQKTPASGLLSGRLELKRAGFRENRQCRNLIGIVLRSVNHINRGRLGTDDGGIAVVELGVTAMDLPPNQDSTIGTL